MCFSKKCLKGIILSAFTAFFIFTQLPLAQAGPQAHRLENGLTVITDENTTQPIVSAQAWIKAGSASEGKFLGSGISHLTEHMLFKSTESFKEGELFKFIKSKGGDISAYTTKDFTAIEILLPKENLQDGLKALKEMLFLCKFDESELEREKQVILNEMKMSQDDPHEHLHELLWSLAYTQKQYGLPIIGEEELLRKITRQDVLEYYSSRYTTKNIVLSIAGDCKDKETMDLVKSLFGAVEQREPPAVVLDPEPAQKSLKEKTDYFDTRPAMLSMAYHTVELTNKDTCALDVLATIMGIGRNSILNKTLKVDKQLAYSVIAYNYTPSFPGLFVIQCSLEKEKIGQAKSKILEIIEKLKKEPVDEKTLQKAKNIISLDMLLELQAIQDQCSDSASGALLAGDPEFTKKYLDGINKVTKKDVLNAANRYLDKNNLTVAALEPKPGAEIPEPLITENEKYIPVKRLSGKIPEEKLRVAASASKDQGIELATLKNGIRVLLKEDHRLPVVSIRVSMLGGLRAENSRNNGVSNLCASLMFSGTKTKSARQLSEITDFMGGNFSTESGNNSTSVYADVLSKDTDTALRLFAEILKDASFPQRELDYEKKVTISQIERLENDVFSSSANILKKNLFGEHPYGLRLLGSKETVGQLERKDVLEFYKKYVTPENMVICIYGDIDKKQAVEKCRNIFGRFKPSLFKQPILQEELTGKGQRQLSHVMDKKEALVLIGFKGARLKDDDRYSLDILTSILSEANGRIFYQIREKLGIAYSLGSVSIPGIEQGSYIFYVATTPDKLELARDKLFEIIREIKSGEITEEETQNAKTSLVSGQIYALQTNGSLARQTGLDELYGLSYKDYLFYKEKIEKITKDDLAKVANKYFDLDSAVVVLTSPERATGQ